MSNVSRVFFIATQSRVAINLCCSCSHCPCSGALHGGQCMCVVCVCYSCSHCPCSGALHGGQCMCVVCVCYSCSHCPCSGALHGGQGGQEGNSLTTLYTEKGATNSTSLHSAHRTEVKGQWQVRTIASCMSRYTYRPLIRSLMRLKGRWYH